MSDQIDPMTGFIKNFDNRADLSMLALATTNRGEISFSFYRINRKLSEALKGQLREDYRCAVRSFRDESTESGYLTASLLPRKQKNHG